MIGRGNFTTNYTFWTAKANPLKTLLLLLLFATSLLQIASYDIKDLVILLFRRFKFFMIFFLFLNKKPMIVQSFLRLFEKGNS